MLSIELIQPHLNFSMISETHKMVTHQIRQFFTLSEQEQIELDSIISKTETRCLKNFRVNRNKYYQECQKIDHLHSAQYTQFLYFLSKEAVAIDALKLADKIYYLNRALNGCDLYHAIDLPSIFTLDHPLGSVMGRASYGAYFAFQQGCNVGNNHNTYPTIGEHVRMFANSTIIGNAHIGHHVFISANTYIKDEDIPPCSIVFGTSPNLVIKSKPESYFEERSLFRKVTP